MTNDDIYLLIHSEDIIEIIIYSIFFLLFPSLLKKENLPMCVFRYLLSYVSLLDWTISGQAASLSRIGILGSG